MKERGSRYCKQEQSVCKRGQTDRRDRHDRHETRGQQRKRGGKRQSVSVCVRFHPTMHAWTQRQASIRDAAAAAGTGESPEASGVRVRARWRV